MDTPIPNAMLSLFWSLSRVQKNLNLGNPNLSKFVLENQKREQKKMSYVVCEFELRLFLTLIGLSSENK